MRVLRLGEIGLYVRALDRAVRFYVDAFGFAPGPADELNPPGDHYRKLRLGDIALCFFEADDDEPALPRGQLCGMTADLWVDDLDAAVAAVEAAGGRAKPIEDWPGGRYAVIRDPDGIVWELIEGT